MRRSGCAIAIGLAAGCTTTYPGEVQNTALTSGTGSVTVGSDAPMRANIFEWNSNVSPTLPGPYELEFDFIRYDTFPVSSVVLCEVAGSALDVANDTRTDILAGACTVTVGGSNDLQYQGPMGSGALVARADLDRAGNGHVAVQLDFDETTMVPEAGDVGGPVSVTVQAQALTAVAWFGNGQQPPWQYGED